MPPFPAEFYPLIMEFFSWYDRNKDKMHPVQLAARVHLKLVTIHPFANGNGRTSRLMIRSRIISEHVHGIDLITSFISTIPASVLKDVPLKCVRDALKPASLSASINWSIVDAEIPRLLQITCWS